MARRVFFSFEYEHDVWRASVVRNSWLTHGREAATFKDSAEFEQVKRGGDRSIKNWIDVQLNGTSVTVVLVGSHTCSSRWVQYEIDMSKYLSKGLLGIDISSIADQNGHSSWCCGQIPPGYIFYSWAVHDGYNNMGHWIEEAARTAGR